MFPTNIQVKSLLAETVIVINLSIDQLYAYTTIQTPGFITSTNLSVHRDLLRNAISFLPGSVFATLTNLQHL